MVVVCDNGDGLKPKLVANPISRPIETSRPALPLVEHGSPLHSILVRYNSDTCKVIYAEKERPPRVTIGGYSPRLRGCVT